MALATLSTGAFWRPFGPESASLASLASMPFATPDWPRSIAVVPEPVAIGEVAAHHDCRRRGPEAVRRHTADVHVARVEKQHVDGAVRRGQFRLDREPEQVVVDAAAIRAAEDHEVREADAIC